MLDAVLLAVVSAGAVWFVMRRQAQSAAAQADALRASEARFRGLTELSADWFWETDEEHRVTWISGGAPVATFFGQAPAYGKRFWEIPGVEVEPRALAAHLERLEQQLAFFDLEISRADERGARQIHIISGQSRLDEEGRFLGYRGVGHDVTEQRKAEQALWRAKERLELALAGANLAEWHIDLGGGEVYAGDGWVRFLGHERSPPQTRLTELFELVHEDDRATLREALVRALKDETAAFTCDFRARTRAGEWKWLHASGRVIEREAGGRALRMSGTVADIDASRRTEAALREAGSPAEQTRSREARLEHEQRLRDFLEASAEYAWESDAQWRYTYLSPHVEAVLGYARAELLGRTPRDFMPLGEPRAVNEWLSAHGVPGGAFHKLVHRSVAKSGRVVWQEVSAVPVRDANGVLKGYRGMAADVTARREAEARVEFLRTRDPLTGLPNRGALADRANRAIISAAGVRASLAVLVVDLDRFRLVNETLGHVAGDALLRAVSERLQNALRREETLARIGGDDFGIVREAPSSAQEASALAQRLLAVLARPFTIENHVLNVSASIGVSLYPADGHDFSELLRRADCAMHQGKQVGGNAFVLYVPGSEEHAAAQLRLENELRGALARSELVLHWQPVVRGRASAGLVVGAEALVRWQHPQRGLLSPDDFVPIAEETGLIRAIGEWTLERALSQAGAWQRRFPSAGTWFAVNVSAPELAQGDRYVKRLQGCLEANALPGNRVELEVTERVLMSHLPENIETLRRIGELGVRFAIDDFGTGYSSLAYLRRLPFDKLKIDRAFLRELATHPADEAIVHAIATLARTLGISIAAEGVETEAQLARLLALGCEEWQGHHFSPPLAAADFEKLLGAPARAAS